MVCSPTSLSWLPLPWPRPPLSCLDRITGTRGGARCLSSYVYSGTLVSREEVVPSALQVDRTPGAVTVHLVRSEFAPSDPDAVLSAVLPASAKGSGFDECSAAGCPERYTPATARRGPDTRLDKLELPGREAGGSDDWFITCDLRWEGSSS